MKVKDGVWTCSTAYQIPENTKLNVTLHLGVFLKQLNGWFNGRVDEPSINTDTKNQDLLISGKAMLVPTIGTGPITYGDYAKAVYPNGVTPDWAKQIEDYSTQRGSGTSEIGRAHV